MNTQDLNCKGPEAGDLVLIDGVWYVVDGLGEDDDSKEFYFITDKEGNRKWCIFGDIETIQKGA